MVVIVAVFFWKKEQVREFLCLLRGSFFRPLLVSILAWLLFCAGQMRVERVLAQEAYVEQIVGSEQQKHAVGAVVEGIVENVEKNEEKKQGSLLIGQCMWKGEGTKGQEVSIPMKGKVTLDWNEEFPKPGDAVRVTGRFSVPQRAANPGEMDYRSYCYARGIGFSGFGSEVRIQKKEEWFAVRRATYNIRIWAAEILSSCLETGDAGILKAVLLGDKNDLDIQEKTLYQTSGIAHLLAISGLHISLLGMGLWKVLRKAGCGLGLAGGAAGLFVLGYVCLTGMGASAVRASVMFCLMLGASILGRTYDIWSALAAAAGILLWDNPRLLFDAGFQLSFGAMGAIAGLGKRLIHWVSVDGRTGACSEAFLISMAVQWVTIPIVCFWYFEFPPYAVLLNLFVIPLMGIVIVSGLSVLGIYGILGWKAAGVMAAGPAHFILRWYHLICTLFQKIPGNQWVIGRPEKKGIFLYYGILLVYVWGLEVWRKREESVSVETETKKSLPALRLACLLVGMGVSVFVLKPPPVCGVEVWFLDVGQGDGILFRTENQNILIDGGSSSQKKLGEYTLKPCLESLGITELDYVFVSHGDSDHTNGILYLLEECDEIEVKYLVLPKGQTDDMYQKLTDAMTKKATAKEAVKNRSQNRIFVFGDGDVWESGKLRLYGMHPSAKKQETDKNNQSMVILAEYGTKCILFTGDIEEEGERELLKTYRSFLEEKEIVLLKVAHHGAKTSTTESFLEAVKPEAAVLSYGADNTYGHPAKETVERLQACGTKLYATGGNGAVHVKLTYPHGETNAAEVCQIEFAR